MAARMRVGSTALVSAVLAGCGGGGGGSSGPWAALTTDEGLEQSELEARVKQAATSLAGSDGWVVDCVNGHGVWYCDYFEGDEVTAKGHVTEFESEFKIDPTNGRIHVGAGRGKEAAE
jgi:hypothetical protein